MNDLLVEKLAIRELVENWVLYRETVDWDLFATVWYTRECGLLQPFL